MEMNIKYSFEHRRNYDLSTLEVIMSYIRSSSTIEYYNTQQKITISMFQLTMEFLDSEWNSFGQKYGILKT